MVETNVFDYALTVILFITDENNEVHLVVFYFYTFTIVELNYDIYNKKLLAIFKAFKIWYHYLKGLIFFINVVIDHKNFDYFSTTKILTHKQV